MRAEFGGLALPLGLHALVDRLAVLLRQIGPPDPHIDHLDAIAAGFMIELIANPRHQSLALVPHHLDEGDFAEHAAQRGVQERRQLDVGSLDRADALIELQRVLDAVAGEGVDHQPLLVGGDHFLRWVFEIEDALVDVDHGVDERRLEMQARLGDDADGLAEPHHQRLLGLRDGEHRAVADDHDKKQQQQRNNTCDGGPHLVAPVGCCGWPVVAGARRGVSSLNGRYGTTLCEGDEPPS